jgi:CheY-like chemotaxis protein
VEEGPENQRIFMHFLKYAGANALLAKNGLEGVEMAKKHSEEISLVLMDIQMPELDGHSATRQLRADGFVQPIVALTAHAFQEEIDRCLLAGFSAYQTKPVDIPELVELVITLTTGDEDVTPKVAPIVSKYADRPAYQELIREFVASLPGYVEKLVEASRGQQWKEAQDIAHTLKGTAGTYGFSELSKLAGKVEDGCQNLGSSPEQDTKPIENAVNSLAVHCGRIRA